MSHEQRIDPYDIEFEMGALVEVFPNETEKQGNIHDRKLPGNKTNITPGNGLVNPLNKRLFVQSERHDQGLEVYLLGKDLITKDRLGCEIDGKFEWVESHCLVQRETPSRGCGPVRASCRKRRMDISPAPRLAPGRLVSNLSSRSLPLMRSTLIPASLIRLLSKNSSVPSSERFSEIWNFLTMTPLPSFTSYSTTYLLFPPASRHAPSAVYAMLLYDFPEALFAAETRSSSFRPPETSLLPSMTFVRLLFSNVKECDLSIQSRDRDLLAIRAEPEGEHIGIQGERFYGPRGAKYIPYPHRFAPRTSRELVGTGR